MQRLHDSSRKLSNTVQLCTFMALMLLAVGCKTSAPAARARDAVQAPVVTAEPAAAPDPRVQEASCQHLSDPEQHELCRATCTAWPLGATCQLVLHYGAAGMRVFEGLGPGEDARGRANQEGFEPQRADLLAWFLHDSGLHADPQWLRAYEHNTDAALYAELRERERACQAIDEQTPWSRLACFQELFDFEKQHAADYPAELITTAMMLTQIAAPLGERGLVRKYSQLAVELARQSIPPEHPLRMQAFYWFAMSQLGGESVDIHRYTIARDALVEADAIARRVYGPWNLISALSQLTIASNAVDQELWEVARDDLAAACETNLKYFGLENRFVASAFSTLGNLLSDFHDYEAAHAAYAQAAAIFRMVLGPWSSEYTGTLISLAHNYLWRNAPVSALEIGEEVYAIATDERYEASDRSARLRTVVGILALAHSQLNDHERALIYIEQQYDLLAQHYGEDAPNVLSILHHRARSLFSAGRVEDALALYEQLAERYMAADVNAYSRQHMFRNLADAYLIAGKPEQARGAMKRSLSNSWADTFEKVEATFDVMQTIAVLQPTHSFLSSALLHFDDPAWTDRARDELLRWRGVSTLVERRRRMGVAPALEASTEPALVCRALAEAKRPLVVYVRFDDLIVDDSNSGDWMVKPRFDAFVIEPKGCKTERVRLGYAEELEPLVDRWHEAINEAEQCYRRRGIAQMCTSSFERLDAAGRAVRQAFWDPVASRLGRARDVFVVPDGRLNEVPLDALRTDEGRYLIEDWQMTWLPYPAAVAHLEQPAGSGGASGAFVAGDVDYGTAIGALEAYAAWQRCSGTSCSDLEPAAVEAYAALRGADEGDAVDGTVCGYGARWAPLSSEATAVATQLSGAFQTEEVILATGAGVVEEAVRAALPGKRIIHLATHGFFASDPSCRALASADATSLGFDFDGALQPTGLDPFKLSAIVLSGANQAGPNIGVPAERDGVLSAREVTTLPLSGTELVVLSACETGRGQLVDGEGALGLARAFLIAGAQTTIVSLWQIPSRPTEELFSDFYPRAFDTSNPRHPAQALRHAKLAALERARAAGITHSAYLWGSFVPLTLAR